MDWRTAHTIVWKSPVVAPDATIGDYIRIATWLAVAVSSLAVGLAFAKAIHQYRARNPRAKLPRKFWLFLALALVSLLVTNGLRFEHKRIKWLVATGQLDLDEANRDKHMPDGMLNDVDLLFDREIGERATEKLDMAARGFEELWPPPYRAGENLEHQARPDVRLQEKILRQARNEIRAEAGVLPYVRPKNWPMALHSSWDYFETLLNTVASYFWTAQWFAGFTAWLLYVVVECERRQLTVKLATAFFTIGSLISLATAQCLLFALLMLIPPGGNLPRHRRTIYIPRTWFAVLHVVHQSFILWMYAGLRQGRSKVPEGPDTTEEGRQAVVGLAKIESVLSSLGFFCSLMFLPRWFSNRRVPAPVPKRAMTVVWSVIAVTGAAVHCECVYLAWQQTDARRRHSFYLGTETHPWLQRRNPMDHLRYPFMGIFGALGSHHWVNALAFDVLFSALALACWTATMDLDARDMVRYGLFPCIDWVVEKWKMMRYHTLPDARANGGLRGGSTRSGANYLLRDDDRAFSGDEGPEWIKRPSRQASRRKGRRPQSREPAPAPVAPVRRRALRSASSQAPSQQPGVQQRTQSRSVGLGIDLPAGAQRGVSLARSRSRAVSEIRRSNRIRERLLSIDDGPEPDDSDETTPPAGPAFEDRAGQAEQAGLALAIFAVGGLGMASAAVFGAEAGRRR